MLLMSRIALIIKNLLLSAIVLEVTVKVNQDFMVLAQADTA